MPKSLSFVVTGERSLQEPTRPDFSGSNVRWMCWCDITRNGSAISLRHSSPILLRSLRFTLQNQDRSILRIHTKTFWSLGPTFLAAETSCGRTVCKLMSALGLRVFSNSWCVSTPQNVTEFELTQLPTRWLCPLLITRPTSLSPP